MARGYIKLNCSENIIDKSHIKLKLVDNNYITFGKNKTITLIKTTIINNKTTT